MDQSLSKLAGLIGGTAHHLGMITQQQIDDVLWTQALLTEIKRQGIAVTEAEVVRIRAAGLAEMQTIAYEKGLDLSEISKSAQTDFGLDKPADEGIPKFAELLEDKGYLPKQKSSPLLAAQAAARMADRMEKLAMGIIEIDMETARSKGSAINPKDALYLVAAQATNNLAELFAAGLAQSPELANDKDIRRAMTAFEVYAAQTLKRAGKELDFAGEHAAGDKVAGSRKSLRDRVNFLTDIANTATLVEDMRKGMKMLPALQPHWELINTRLEQSRGMKHRGFGISLLSDLRSKHDINAANWQERVSRGHDDSSSIRKY